MEVYDVERTGEISSIEVVGKLGDALKSDRVLLIVVSNSKLIYLWKGISSPVAKKFIGARMGQTLRGEKGLVFRVIPVDEEDEPSEFVELRDMDGSQIKVGIAAGASAKTASRASLSEDLKNLLLNEELDRNFTREGIIIGKDYYAVTESKANVLGKEVINHEIQKTEDLPDGILFDQNYGIRILINKNGQVDAIEILKRN